MGRSKPERTCSGVAHPEAGGDLVGDLLGRGRRAGHHRRPPEPVGDLRQAQVVGAEVVPPLGDAVGLVDREQVDAPLRQSLEEDVRAEALRRAVDDPRLAAADLVEGAAGRLVAHPRGDHRHRVPGRRSGAATGRCISAISGLTTIVRSSDASPGSW